jgi:hypothetical protein
MSGNQFFDTNIFVYAVSDDDSVKQAIARKLILEAEKFDTGRASFQVAQEWMNVVTKKFSRTISTEGALEFVERTVVPFIRVVPDLALLQEGIRIKERFQISFYDALIVAAAKRQKCGVLYSEDLQAGMVFHDVQVVNPFAG